MLHFALITIILGCLCILCVFIANFKIIIPRKRKKILIQRIRTIERDEGMTKSAINHKSILHSIIHYS